MKTKNTNLCKGFVHRKKRFLIHKFENRKSTSKAAGVFRRYHCFLSQSSAKNTLCYHQDTHKHIVCMAITCYLCVFCNSSIYLDYTNIDIHHRLHTNSIGLNGFSLVWCYLFAIWNGLRCCMQYSLSLHLSLCLSLFSLLKKICVCLYGMHRKSLCTHTFWLFRPDFITKIKTSYG